MTAIKVVDGTFRISGFGTGQAMLRPSSVSFGDRNILHFCCYDPLAVGARGTLLDGGATEPIKVRVIERFGDYYNVEVLEADEPE